jgi:hypothetical protein
MASLTPDTKTLFLLYIETECDCCNRRTIRLMAESRVAAFKMAWDIIEAREKHTTVTRVKLMEPDDIPFWEVIYEYADKSPTD